VVDVVLFQITLDVNTEGFTEKDEASIMQIHKTRLLSINVINIANPLDVNEW
jgi:hypothetical protein